MEPVRLQRYLSQCGVASRRKSEELISAGRVQVNGKRVTELGSKVDPGNDRVTVDGAAVYPEDLVYILLNKPKGCITAVSDPQGRPTVMEFLPGVPAHVAPVGRLDFYSEGVLLLTNDGELAAALLAPRNKVEKTYHVKVRGTVTPAHLQLLRDGVRLDDGTRTRPAQVDELPAPSKHSWLVVTLTEGKNRQVRRMLEALDYTVTKLQRVAFAGLTFHGLRVGDARELKASEVNDLRRLAGIDTSGSVSRGRWQAKREQTELARRARKRARDEAAAEPGAAPSPAAQKKPSPRRQPAGRRASPPKRATGAQRKAPPKRATGAQRKSPPKGATGSKRKSPPKGRKPPRTKR